MGYYTHFTMRTQPYNKDAEDALMTTSGYSWYECGGFQTLEEAKWYDHIDDLEKVSARFPDTIFHIEGEGEESGDLYHVWAHNGNVERVDATITYPEPSWVAEARTNAENARKEREQAAMDAREKEERDLLAKLKEKYPDA